jgi:hypothetical protein
MDFLDDILIAWIVWNCCHRHRLEEQRLHDLRHLLPREPVTPRCDSPSPHQLLGDIARPLVAPGRVRRPTGI